MYIEMVNEEQIINTDRFRVIYKRMVYPEHGNPIYRIILGDRIKRNNVLDDTDFYIDFECNTYAKQLYELILCGAKSKDSIIYVKKNLNGTVDYNIV